MCSRVRPYKTYSAVRPSGLLRGRTNWKRRNGLSEANPVTPDALEQSEFGQFTPHMVWQIARVGTGTNVAGNILRLQITPTLEWTTWLPFSADHLRLQHQTAALDSLAIEEWTDIENSLPALHHAFDDPVKRAAAGDLFDPLRHHARDMILLDGFVAALLFFQPLGNPIFQVFRAFAAHAQFYEMKRHGRTIGNIARKVNATAFFPQA